MLSTPLSRRISSVGAVMETGVLCTVSSRFMAVTVTASAILTSREKLMTRLAPAASVWPF
jgi:hypothetical protein